MNDTPWFEDFSVGDDFSDVPSITITEGYAALHQALFGDRLRLPLDQSLCTRVTGHALLAHPSLVSNLAIGQSTLPSQRVMGNLFYRGLVLQRPVFIGDTLTTQTRVVALRQNRIREGRPASGMVVLEMRVGNQHGGTVMHCFRCPMVPCRDPDADTGMSDDFANIPEVIPAEDVLTAVPEWNYDTFRSLVPGRHFDSYSTGDVFEVEARDTVTCAPELARLTLNMAMTHTDATRSVYGRRLVYGGHTIAIATAQLVRALPNLLTVLAWYRCDHSAPVFEGDILRSVVTITGKVDAGPAGITNVNVAVFADRGEQAPEPGENIKVLDWDLAALMAQGGSEE